MSRYTDRVLRRLSYVALAIGTLAAGLATHAIDTSHPTVAGDIAGDALWAMLVVWLVSAATPTPRFVTRGSVAFAIAVAVECSQLIHAPVLDAIRATTLGSLVLGTGFDLRDIGSYGAGVLVAAVVERVTSKQFLR